MKSTTINHRFRTYTNNKFERPFLPDHVMHVIFKSEIAKGEFSLLHPNTRQWLLNYVPGLCNKLNIRMHNWAIQSDHLHFVMAAGSRKQFQYFLRAVASRVARFVLKAERGSRKGIQFWSRRPYSRILTWGREIKHVLRYVERNIWEAKGKIPYCPRNRKAMRQTQHTVEKFDRQQRFQFF